MPKDCMIVLPVYYDIINLLPCMAGIENSLMYVIVGFFPLFKNRGHPEIGKSGKGQRSWKSHGVRKVVEFCDQSWNFTDFAPLFCQVCVYFTDIFNIYAKCEYKVPVERWSLKSHGRSFCKVCGNPEKYQRWFGCCLYQVFLSHMNFQPFLYYI